MHVTTYIKSRITTEQVKNYLESNGSRNLTMHEDQLRCTCPIHHGDNPTAFAYDMDKHLWVCFTGDCGGGDIFDLVEKLSGYSFNTFPDLIRYTASTFGIDIEGMNLDIRREAIRQENQRWLVYMSRKKTKNSSYDLTNIGRVSEVEAGYRGFTRETLDTFEVKHANEFDRIAIPLKDENNRVVGVTMRKCNEQERIKWLHKPRNIDTGDILFNYGKVASLQTDDIILVEGCFDVMRLWQCNVYNAVACLGAHLTDNQEKMLLRRFTNILLAYDGDSAGIACTNKVIDRLKNKANIKVLELGDIHDPGEIYTREQYDSLKQLKWYEWRKLHGF